MQLRLPERPTTAPGLSVFVLLVAISSAAGCSKGAAPAAIADAAAGDDAVLVTVAPVVQKAMPLEIRVIGTAEAESTVAVHAQITGAITSVNFKEGDDVADGQVLFTLDHRPLEATLRRCRPTLRVISRRRRTRGRRPAATRRWRLAASSRGRKCRPARPPAAALEATVEADRAALDNANVQLEYATIKAPIAGRTGALIVHPGKPCSRQRYQPARRHQSHRADQRLLSASPRASCLGSSRYLAERIAAGRGDRAPRKRCPSTGQISFIDNAVDQTTGTIRIKRIVSERGSAGCGPASSSTSS